MDVSIIVEWENAILADMERPTRMLRTLRSQAAARAAERGQRFELLIVLNSEEVDPAVPKAVVGREIPAEAWPGEIAFLDGPGGHYYDLKNLGARAARNETILFLDSDVVPEDGWLAALLDVMDDPAVDLVAGNTFLEPTAFLDRCFALFWVFEPKGPRPERFTRPRFWANNIAFRRDAFLAAPYGAENCYRGQCAAMAAEFRARGIEIPHAGRAWVSHPAPNGWAQAAVRAAARGYDNVYWRRRRSNDPRAASLRGALRNLVHGLRQVGDRVRRRAPALGAGPLTAAAALAAGSAYQLIVFGAELASIVAPAFVRRNVTM